MTVRSFFEWFGAQPGLERKPWLILGKGPTFSKRGAFDLSAYALLALNDAAREIPVDVAHAIDIQVVERSGEAIAKNARVLAMPWHPHVDFNAGAMTLEQHAQRYPVLQKLAAEGRLLWYNLSTASYHRSGAPVISARYFSAEAALNLLVEAGVRLVRSLGVDGGATYSPAFQDLNDRSLLSNRRSSFDIQFQEIARTIQRTGVDFAPLDIEGPIRVYVATTEAQMLAVKVLEYSIRKHASMTVRVFPLHLAGIEIPLPEEQKNWPRTPFSFQRYLIPRLADGEGRAIYLDSDMQVFRDIRYLWTLPLNGADLLAVGDTADTGRRPQFSVMVLDCEALDWDIGRFVEDLNCGRLSYEQLVYEMAVAKRISATIPATWNSLETYREGETALLHYTDMDTQPWVYADHRYGYLWVRDLIEAVDNGFVSLEGVRTHAANGWVRPSLVWQVENRHEDGALMPRKARVLDKGFRPPFFAARRQPASPWVHGHRWTRAALSALYRRTPLFKLQRRLSARSSRG